MKSFVSYFAVLIVTAVTFTGCNHATTLDHFGWRSISPTFDSLTIAAEQGLYVDFDSLSLAENVREMSAEADRLSGDKASDARARVQYWTANMHAVTGSFTQVMEALDSASALNDSVRFPYTAHRIANLRTFFEPHRDMSALEYNLREMDYYKHLGEHAQQGNMAMMIGNSLHFTEAPELSLKYYKMADSLFELAGLEGRRSFIRLNQASLMAYIGDTLGGGG